MPLSAAEDWQRRDGLDLLDLIQQRIVGLDQEPECRAAADARVQLSESLEGRVTVYSGNTKLQQLGR